MKKNYIIYDKTGTILRCGYCLEENLHNQAEEGEFMILGVANDLEDKIVDGKKVKKTKKEKENNPKINIEDQPALISNKELQNLLDRLDKLENKE
jgi:hypothetical protein